MGTAVEKDGYQLDLFSLQPPIKKDPPVVKNIHIEDDGLDDREDENRRLYSSRPSRFFRPKKHGN